MILPSFVSFPDPTSHSDIGVIIVLFVYEHYEDCYCMHIFAVVLRMRIFFSN